MTKEALSKPYPNYHSARVKAADLFLKIRVLNTTKTGVMIYGGALKTKPKAGGVVQSIKFPKEKYNPKQAKAWLKEHKLPATAYTFEAASEEKTKSKCKWPSITGE